MDSAVEKRLGKFYDLDGMVPSTVMPTIVNLKVFNNKTGTIKNRSEIDSSNLKIDMRPLWDDNINYGKREIFAEALLKGKQLPPYPVASDSSPKGGQLSVSTFQFHAPAPMISGNLIGLLKKPRNRLEVSSSPLAMNSIPRKDAHKQVSWFVS